jgi:hypothetical protein
MASTRNINTRGNYYLENKQYRDSEKYNLYKNSQHGEAYKTTLPGNGLNPAQIPANKLSNNSIEIESFLFGINSTNLVYEQPILIPEFKELNTTNIYNKSPVIMPQPLVIERNRPYPI